MPRKSPQLAKLSRPRLFNAVPRERLYALLDEKLQHPMVWISGPPGAGKTTLVASYLDARRRLNFWYQCDTEDADPATVFYYLSQLAKQAARTSRSSLPFLTPEYLQDLPGFARRYFRSFYARLPQGSVVVFDNFHEATGDKLHLILDNALSQLPESINLVVVSRTGASSDLSRHLANNVAVTVDWDQLRMTPEEAAEIARSQGVTDDRLVNALLTRSNGWVAGMTLMLAAQRGGRLIEQDHLLDSRTAVFDYFASELLEKASNVTREVLLQTALFPQFSAEIAEEITGLCEAPAVLEELYRQHYFTERRSGEKKTYRYHDLFREFLLTRGSEVVAASALRGLRARAGSILLREGMTEQGIALLRDAGENAAVADAVERLAEQLLAQGRWQPLVAWCEAANAGEQRPWVTYWHGLAVAATDAHAARRILERAYHWFNRCGERMGETLACSAIMDSFFQHWDMVDELDNWIARMEGLLDTYEDMPDQVRARALSSMVVSMLHRQPCHASLPSYAEEAYTRVPTTTDANQKYVMTASLIYYYNLRGSMNRANELIAMTEPYIDQADVLPVNALTWWYRCGLHYLYDGNAEAAARPCYRGLELARTHGTGWVGYVSAFMAEITQGKLDVAGELLTESRKVLDPANRMHLIAVYWLELWLLVVRGKMSEAVALWEDFGRVPTAGVPIHTVFNHCVIVVLVHQKQYEDALERIRYFHELLDGMRSPVIDFNLLCMEAYVRLNAGDAVRGRQTLARMMEIGRSGEIMITLCWVPAMMSYLCAAALEYGIEPAYVQALIRKRNLVSPRDDLFEWPRPYRVLCLGRFEILRDEIPVEYSRKAPKKLVALLKLIVAHGVRGVAVEDAADALWPDLEGDSAHEAFATNLHRLRKLLGRTDVVRLTEGRLTLDAALCWTDAGSFDRLFDFCFSARERGDVDGTLKYATRAMQLYRGSFLPLDAGQPWSVAMRERLRGRFIRLVSQTAGYYEAIGDAGRAMEWYYRGVDADNLVEEFYQGLMRCYAAEGRWAEGVAAYRQLRQLLSVVLGVEPSAVTQELGQRILAQSYPSRVAAEYVPKPSGKAI